MKSILASALAGATAVIALSSCDNSVKKEVPEVQAPAAEKFGKTPELTAPPETTEAVVEETAPAVTPEAANPAAEDTEAAATSALKVGDAAPALEGITWVQGGPIASLDEKGKVYFLELWATWCGPCVAIIPHVNEWHKKYSDKGLVIIGMNVFEDEIATAQDFVKQQGAGMSYPVAFSGGSGSAFEQNWLAPAGIQSIPHAIVVKDGKILFIGHPGGITDATLESMLGSDFDADKFAAKAQEEAQATAKLQETVAPLFQAEDWDGILKVASELDDSNPAKIQLQLTAVSQKGDWKELLVLRSKVAADSSSGISLEQIDQSAALGMDAAEGSTAYAKVALASIPATKAGDPVEKTVHSNIMKSRLLFLAGKKDQAKALIKVTKPLVKRVTNPQLKNQLDGLLPAISSALAKDKFPSVFKLLQQQ